MSQTGFSGITDILVLNPPSGPARNLKDYPAAVVAGDIKWNKAVVDALRDYVRKGGILVINSEQLPKESDSSFTGVIFTGKTAADKGIFTPDGKKISTEELAYKYHSVKLKGADVLLQTADKKPLATVFEYGKGKVILTLQKYLVEEPEFAGQKKGLATVHYLLSMLRNDLLPVKVTGDSAAEMVVSRLTNGWRISLLNNRGVYKQPLTAPVIVSSEQTVQTLTFPAEFKFATEKISGRELEVKKVKGMNQTTVTIPAGELMIIDIVSEK